MTSLSLDIFELQEKLREQVQSELRASENIVWLGQPIPKQMMWCSWPLVLFAIPWTAFSIFWTVGAAGFKVPDLANGFDFFPLFGLPFILIGLGMLSAPWWLMRGARRTAYVITNERLILIEGGSATTIRSYSLSQLELFHRKQYSDGSGDLILDRMQWRDSDGDRQKREIGFFAIANVKGVEDLVRRLSDEARIGKSQA